MKQSAYQTIFEFLKSQESVSSEISYSGIQAHWYEESHTLFTDDVQMIESIMKHLKPSRVIELGSGAGRIATAVCKHADDYLALDNSSSMISMLEKKIEASQIPHLRAMAFDFMGSQETQESKQGIPCADLVILANNSIYYTETESGCSQLFALVSKMLMPGGHFLVDWSPVSAGGSTTSLLSMDKQTNHKLGTRIEIVNPVFDPATRKRRVHFLNIDFSETLEPRLSFYEENHYIPTIAEITLNAKMHGLEIISKFSDYKPLSPFADHHGAQCSLLFKKK